MVSPKGQDITPKLRLAWRPGVRCQLPHSPAGTSRSPSQEQGPLLAGLGVARPGGGRAGDQRWVHPAGLQARQLPPWQQTSEQGNREHAELCCEIVNGFPYCSPGFGKNGCQVFLKLP